MERSVIRDGLTRDYAALHPGYQVATNLAPVMRRDRTALISLGIPKLVRFAKIRHRSVSNRSLLALLYLSKAKSRGSPQACKSCSRHVWLNNRTDLRRGTGRSSAAHLDRPNM